MAYADKDRFGLAGITNLAAQTSAFDLHGLLLFQSLMLTRPRSDHERTFVFGTDQLAASKLAFAYNPNFSLGSELWPGSLSDSSRFEEGRTQPPNHHAEGLLAAHLRRCGTR